MRFLHPADYQPRLIEAYAHLREKILQVLPECEVEHIGSSAIKGAISKGDLDILVRVNKHDFNSAIPNIEALGFSIKVDTLRTESLCMLEGPNGSAIQLIERGTKFEMFVLFRNIMNESPELVEQYNRLKLASRHLTADGYRTKKSEFISAVLDIEAGRA